MSSLPRLCRLAAVLLSYPDDTTRECAALVHDELATVPGLSAEERAALGRLANELATQDSLVLQSRYVDLFDRTRSVSLHLFEHVHGDSRDRGQAMVDLNVRYAEAGFALSVKELPDYLPALCELASVAPEVCLPLLRDAGPLLSRIFERLAGMGSGYAPVLGALCRLLGEVGNLPLPVQPSELQPPTADELDAEWAEEPVTFGVMGALDNAQAQGSAARRVSLRRSVAGEVLT